jgi:hydroxymethylpyrimidine/phosphomethylpyrimidine kinase
VKLLGAGTLKQEQFAYYLKQDYLFLIQFARTQALIGAKSSTIQDIVASAKIVAHVHEEMSLHINYCRSFGISEPEIASTEEDIACTAYTRYVLDVGQSHDVLGLLVATAPCLFGYHEIGRWLLEKPATKREGNPYLKWMQNYGESAEYIDAVKVGRELLERKIRAAGVDRLEELVEIFAHATKMEAGFWKMGLEGPGRRLA